MDILPRGWVGRIVDEVRFGRPHDGAVRRGRATLGDLDEIAAVESVPKPGHIAQDGMIKAARR